GEWRGEESRRPDGEAVPVLTAGFLPSPQSGGEGLQPRGSLPSRAAPGGPAPSYRRRAPDAEGEPDMADAPPGVLLRCVRATARAADSANRPDRELLDAFRLRGDASAFEALLRRHGPLVLAACRTVLRGAADVEDAFQATFLALVRRADAVRGERSLGGWLFRVARRAALQARKAEAGRRRREERVIRPGGASDPADLSWRE